MPGITGKYFEDYELEEVFESPGRTITETDLVLYAGLSGDYHQVHTDEDYCKGRSVFKKRILHGLFALILVEGLKSRLGHFEGTSLASLEWNWKFLKPLFIGDTVHVRWHIKEKRETKKPDRGIMIETVQLISQNGDVIGEGDHVIMIQRSKKE